MPDATPTNYAGQVASQETEIRDAEHKPDPTTIAQSEVVQAPPADANDAAKAAHDASPAQRNAA
jgi:hypothetical protein